VLLRLPLINAAWIAGGLTPWAEAGVPANGGPDGGFPYRGPPWTFCDDAAMQVHVERAPYELMHDQWNPAQWAAEDNVRWITEGPPGPGGQLPRPDVQARLAAALLELPGAEAAR